MVGINENVVIRATRVNLDRNPTQKQLHNSPLVPDYKSEPKQRNTLRAVVGGSNRAPDRLHAANLMESDACKHPDCKGVRCTTEHLFWECAAHKSTRQPFKDRIAKQMGDTQRKHPLIFKSLKKDVQQPCFRNCGICPGDKDIWLAYNKAGQEIDNLYGPPNDDAITFPELCQTWEDDRLVAYPDGSAIHADYKLHA